MNQFHHLGLSEPILKAIKELGFETPSEIQKKAIPHLILGNQDFIGLAQTGTGKTAAFGLPMLEHIDAESPHVQALILTPTRELGQQVAEQITLFSQFLKKIQVVAVYGGAPIERQIKQLRKPTQVIIATPGRLVDLLRRKAVRLNQLEFLILDEADEMLNMGFKDELDSILKQTPNDKVTWLFSATMSKEVRSIAGNYMFDPLEVRVNAKQEVNNNISHQYATVKRNNKAEALFRLLDIDQELRGIVFCRTRRETQDLAEKLMQKKYRADALHGDLSQPQRDRVMKRFRDKQLQVLIATDIAARGIDVSELSHVFHYSLPDETAYYTHRSGRTARAGNEGISIALVDERDIGKVKRITNELKINFEKVDIPKASEIVDARMLNWSRGILNQKSKGIQESELFVKVNQLFGNLTKEELVAKLIAKEIEANISDSDLDLNHKHEGGGGREKSSYRKRGGGKRFSKGKSSNFKSKRNSSSPKGGNGRRKKRRR